MAVTTPYNYFNRQILDTEKHNENVYSTNSGQGIVSEINGGINTYSADYRVQKEHVWPEEAVRARQDFALESLDYFSNAMSENDDTSYRAVAGCSTRVYVPYSSTLSLWQWSAFIHAFKVRTSNVGELDDDDQLVTATTVAPNVFIKAFLNGSALEHTKRTIPTSATYRTTNTATAFVDGHVQESRFALQFDMSHLQETVASGWHDLALRIYMEPVLKVTTSATDEGGFYEGAIGSSNCTFHHRVSFGIRNARVLTIL
tara:strand:- start:379 stop:1152 length:774 start_codon:yes stop_codon:yes gene_type:complete